LTTTNLIKEFCKEKGIEYVEGLTLVMEAVRYASKSKNNVYPFEEEFGDIVFCAQSISGERRAINMKPNVLTAAIKRLKTLVERKQLNDSLINSRQSQTVVRGTFGDRARNGYYIALPNAKAFMPLERSVKQEEEAESYRAGKALHFAVLSSGAQRNGLPRIALSRRSVAVAKEVAEHTFAMYGFVNVKRMAGIKQTILLRAYPQRDHQTLYQSYFPTERITYRKMLIDGTIAPYNGRRKETNATGGLQG
jgi:hypothetical protein